MKDYTKHAVRGAGFVFAFSILGAFFGYLVRMLLARNLSQTDYGLFYAVLTFVAFVSIFKDLGLSQALVKFIPVFEIKKRHDQIKSAIISVTLIQLFFSFIVTFFLIYFSDYLAQYYFKDSNAGIVVIFLAIFYLLRPITFIYACIFQGFQKMYYYATCDLLRMFFIWIISFLGFSYMHVVVVPAFAYLITPFFVSLIFIPLILIKVFPEFLTSKYSYNPKLIRQLFIFGLPTMLLTAGWVILGYTDTIMLTYFSGLKDVAYYNVALPTANLIGFFGTALASIIFPLTSELMARKYKDKLVTGISSLYKYSILFILPVSLIMFAYPEFVILILFGSDYIIAKTALQILSLSMIFLTIAKVNFSALSGMGKPALVSKIILFSTIFNIIANLILIPIYGFVGAAITTFCGYLLMMGLSLFFLGKKIEIKAPYFDWFKNIVAASFFLGSIYFLKYLLELNIWLEAFLVISVSCVIYLAILFILNIFNYKEIRSIIKRII